MTPEDGTDRLYPNVGNYQSTLRNTPEGRRSRSHRGGNLKSRKNRSYMTSGAMRKKGRHKSLTQWRVVAAQKTGNLTQYHEQFLCVFQPTGQKIRIFFTSTGTPRLRQQLHCGRTGASGNLRKSELNTHMCVYKGVQQKSLVRHTGTRSTTARPPRRLCYRPAVFFHHTHLTAPSFPQGKKNSTPVSKCYRIKSF